ncbi:hypothetical protein MRX96_048235 [Rhipicephalus microplus]
MLGLRFPWDQQLPCPHQSKTCCKGTNKLAQWLKRTPAKMEAAHQSRATIGAEILRCRRAPLNQPSTTRGRCSGSSRTPQVRWLSVESPENIGSPPITYSSQGNDYEAYLEGYMADAEEPFGWPSEGYSSATPIPAFPSHYEVPPSDPYNVLSAYNPHTFYWPQMAPYPGALVPVTSGPFYGYASTYAPGYSDFFALYPGYASYEPLHQAIASSDWRESQLVVQEPPERPVRASSTPSLEASSSKSTKSIAYRPSVKVKDADDKAKNLTLGDKRDAKKTGKETPNNVKL